MINNNLLGGRAEMLPLFRNVGVAVCATSEGGAPITSVPLFLVNLRTEFFGGYFIVCY